MGFPVDRDEFRDWCQKSGGYSQSTRNSITNTPEEVCTFDVENEEDGSHVKTFMDSNGYLFAQDHDGDTMHKMHNVEHVTLRVPGRMNVRGPHHDGDSNYHEFDFRDFRP